ncbi:MAG: hypothetical protein ACREH4_03995 [Vitreimonas sp.]
MHTTSPNEQGSLRDRLPKRLSDWVWNISYLLAWVALPNAIVSVIAGLPSVVDATMSLYREADAPQPVLDLWSLTILGALDLWRTVTALPLDWLRDEQSIEAQQQHVDFAIIVVLCLPSLMRYLFQQRARERRAQLAATKAELAHAEEAAHAHAHAAARENSAAGAILGGVIGAIVGALFPPLLFAAVAVGASIGAVAGESSAHAEPEREAAIAALRRKADAEAKAVAMADRRLIQARALVLTSAILVLFAALLVVTDSTRRDGAAGQEPPPFGARATCETRMSPGEPCACRTAPEKVGQSRRSEYGTANYCWVAR